MKIEEFERQNSQQIQSYPLSLQALWHDYQLRVRDCAWVHADLHRQEKDLSNARYWYRRSGKPESNLSLNEETERIAGALLKQI